MTQRELNRAVARATGESLKEVRNRGFSLADPAETDFDPEPNSLPPQLVNWDRVDAQRYGLFPVRREGHLAANLGGLIDRSPSL